MLSWKEHGDCHAVIERLDPPRLFAFRWTYEMDIEPDPGRSTLVEFFLSEEDGGTRLRIVESGFATLAVTDEERARRLEGNTGGWQEHLDRLREYAGR